uniref:Uncharacterized protein n=1 Tax=Oryza punctata TaxID=4537 RepID=A0A0E0K724_ORYPU
MQRGGVGDCETSSTTTRSSESNGDLDGIPPVGAVGLVGRSGSLAVVAFLRPPTRVPLFRCCCCVSMNQN